MRHFASALRMRSDTLIASLYGCEAKGVYRPWRRRCCLPRISECAADGDGLSLPWVTAIRFAVHLFWRGAAERCHLGRLISHRSASPDAAWHTGRSDQTFPKSYGMLAHGRDVLLDHVVTGLQNEVTRTLVEAVDRELPASDMAQACSKILASTTFKSRVELTAWATSARAWSSATERESSCVFAWTSSKSRTFSMAMTAWSAKVVAGCVTPICGLVQRFGRLDTAPRDHKRELGAEGRIEFHGQ